MGIVLPQIARAFAGTPNAALLSQLIGGITASRLRRLAPRRRLIDRMAQHYLFLVIFLFAVAGTSVILLNNLYLILITRVVLGALVAGRWWLRSPASAYTGREQAKLLAYSTLVGLIGAHFLLCRCSTSEFGGALLCAAFARL